MYEIGTPVVILPSKYFECEWAHCEGVVTEVSHSDSNMLVRTTGGREVWLIATRIVSKMELAYRAELGI